MGEKWLGAVCRIDLWYCWSKTTKTLEVFPQATKTKLYMIICMYLPVNEVNNLKLYRKKCMHVMFGNK